MHGPVRKSGPRLRGDDERGHSVGITERLSAGAEAVAERIDTLKTQEQRQSAEQQLTRQRTLAARADYFAGWSAYYLGVVRQDNGAAKADYRNFCLRDNILSHAAESQYLPVVNIAMIVGVMLDPIR